LAFSQSWSKRNTSSITLKIGQKAKYFAYEQVDQNAASLERLDGVRILVNGWRLSERLQPNIKRRYLYQPENSQRSVTSANRRVNG
jgi:hypothetical protein